MTVPKAESKAIHGTKPHEENSNVMFALDRPDALGVVAVEVNC